MKMCHYQNLHAFDSISSETLGLVHSFVESVTELQEESTNTAVTTSVPMIEPPEHEGELNYISKYLIQYVPVKKVQKASKRATGARVLTSDEYNVQRVFSNKMKRKGRKRKKKKQGRLNESKRRKNEKKLLNRKQKKMLKKGRGC